MAHAHPHPHPHPHPPAQPAASQALLPDELITLHALSYDAASNAVSFASTSAGSSSSSSSTSSSSADPAVASELVQLNALIRAITSVNDKPQPLPPNIPPHLKMQDYVPPPPMPTANYASNHIAKAKEDGNTAFRQQKYADAIRLYSISAALASSRPTFDSSQYSRDELSIALCNRSAAYAADGKWIEALADANAVIGLKKQWTKGHFRRGKALVGLGRLDEARQAVLLGLEFEPANEDLANALDEVEKASKEQLEKSTSPSSSS